VEEKTTTSWNEEMVAQLSKLWDEGLSTGEIGKRLGVSKNAVVGKAHRLGLNSRPSPIKRSKPKPKKEQLPTLADLGPSSCRWPTGDPKEPGFHFCGKKSVPGKPYCAEHAEIAYVNTSKKSDSQSQNAQAAKS